MNVVVIVPAYNPPAHLLEFVREISATAVLGIVVVNDGSLESYESSFHAIEKVPKVKLLRHAVNLGKGAALKTGFNHALLAFPNAAGVVTADADGQHRPEDVIRVASSLLQDPSSVHLGSRAFPDTVPLRSRFGNVLTRYAVRAFLGMALSDTQTGLRGIPRMLLPHLLRVKSRGYEFELDMLILAKQAGCAFRQVRIETVYLEDNRSSHFNPITDSLRIYFTLLRFLTVSVLTAFIDGLVFAAVLLSGGSLHSSQIAARAVALVFNYCSVRRIVFFSSQRHALVFPRYILLVIVSGIVSYSVIRFLIANLPIGVLPAKIIAESLIFLANFAIQRDFIFSKGEPKTDWDAYYQRPAPTAAYARRFTENLLHRIIRQVAGKRIGRLVEIGGANSCFLDGILREFQVGEYHIIDKNETGLRMLSEHPDLGTRVFTHHADVLALDMKMDCDLVFSVGLIEHFAPTETAHAIRAHFELLRGGGIVILAFPTPTWLYRATRFAAEFLGLWRFPDERPLGREEVLRSIPKDATVVCETINWPICLTQRVIVAKKGQSGSVFS